MEDKMASGWEKVQHISLVTPIKTENRLKEKNLLGDIKSWSIPFWSFFFAANSVSSGSAWFEDEVGLDVDGSMSTISKKGKSDDLYSTWKETETAAHTRTGNYGELYPDEANDNSRDNFIPLLLHLDNSYGIFGLWKCKIYQSESANLIIKSSKTTYIFLIY